MKTNITFVKDEIGTRRHETRPELNRRSGVWEALSGTSASRHGLNDALKKVDKNKTMTPERKIYIKKSLIQKYLSIKAKEEDYAGSKSASYKLKALKGRNSPLSEANKTLVNELKTDMENLEATGKNKLKDKKTELSKKNEANKILLKSLESEFKTNHEGKAERHSTIWGKMERAQQKVNTYEMAERFGKGSSTDLENANNELTSIQNELEELNKEDNFKNDEDAINKLQEEIDNFAENLETALKATEKANRQEFFETFGISTMD